MVSSTTIALIALLCLTLYLQDTFEQRLIVILVAILGVTIWVGNGVMAKVGGAAKTGFGKGWS